MLWLLQKLFNNFEKSSSLFICCLEVPGKGGIGGWLEDPGRGGKGGKGGSDTEYSSAKLVSSLVNSKSAILAALVLALLKDFIFHLQELEKPDALNVLPPATHSTSVTTSPPGVTSSCLVML